ncbi:predicted protein [Naegleria gruberi]|uniref:Predicted protein n=1 Tax=Naegleria gruberi TaxID=5762 RepID=D2VLW7_NAEGR|nr:uncharacterized protein NAEGRDRAFT_69925 [Naegleria gruberi]EFC42126.1 predicted protein [Naegleria gruberi]|eukprot:XP_002674870.1 predicted protein [Naegleria gruberi strain NEG-M]
MFSSDLISSSESYSSKRWKGANCDEPICDSKCRKCYSPNQCALCDGNYSGDRCDSCTSGWTGSDCNTPVCDSKCTTCDSPNQCSVCKGNFEGSDCSTCKSGWSESDCNTPVCDLKCKQCDSPNQCSSCNGNFAGSDCSSCKSGWTGSLCDIPICDSKCTNCSAPSKCSKCQGNFQGFECDSCTDGWKGTDCDQPICDSKCSVCDSPNQCRVCNGNFEGSDCSICTTGWKGANCVVPICDSKCTTCDSPNQCSVCQGNYKGAQCDNCQDGWTGTDCNKPICDSKCTTCDSPAKCSKCQGNFQGSDCSSCKSGWKGANCDEPICDSKCSECSAPNQCSTCSDNYDGNDCSGCKSGYSGTNCSLSICYGLTNQDANVCSGHGSCVLPSVCKCNSKWFGDNCELTSCYGIMKNDTGVCSKQGSCIGPDVCSCKTGYKSSADCSVVSCENLNSCSSHGSCVGPNSCTCSAGWKSSGDCSSPSCELVSNCNARGSCSGPNVCTCSGGFFGKKCELATCFGVAGDLNTGCSGNGECFTTDTCSCNAGYYGARCDFKVNLEATKKVTNFKQFFIEPTVYNPSGLSIGYKWSQVGGPSINLESISENTISNPKLVIRSENGLTKGQSYTLLLTTTRSDNVIITNSIVLNVNIDPVIDWFSTVNPSTGQSVGIAGVTSFNASIASATDPDGDSDSLQYSFGYIVDGKRFVSKEFSYSTSTIFRLPLPSNNLAEVFYIAKDDMGATTEVQSVVVVNNPSSSMNSSQIAKLVDSMLEKPSIDQLYFATSLIKSSSDSESSIVKNKIIDALYNQTESNPELAVAILSELSNKTLDNSHGSKALRMLEILSNISDSYETILQTSSKLISYTQSTSENRQVMNAILENISSSLAKNMATGSIIKTISNNLLNIIIKNNVDLLNITLPSSIGVNGLTIPTSNLKNVVSNHTIAFSITILPSSSLSFLSIPVSSSVYKIKLFWDSGVMINITKLNTPFEFEMTVVGTSSGVEPECRYFDERTNTLTKDGVETIVISPTRVKCRVYQLGDFTTTLISKATSSPAPEKSKVQPKISQRANTASTTSQFSFMMMLLFVIVVVFML